MKLALALTATAALLTAIIAKPVVTCLYANWKELK